MSDTEAKREKLLGGTSGTTGISSACDNCGVTTMKRGVTYAYICDVYVGFLVDDISTYYTAYTALAIPQGVVALQGSD